MEGQLKLLFCKKWRILGTQGEGWRSGFGSVVMRSERSLNGCTHSGGGRGVKEDARLRDGKECEIGKRIEGLGVLRSVEMVVERGFKRAFLICALMITGSSVLLHCSSR